MWTSFLGCLCVFLLYPWVGERQILNRADGYNSYLQHLATRAIFILRSHCIMLDIAEDLSLHHMCATYTWLSTKLFSPTNLLQWHVHESFLAARSFRKMFKTEVWPLAIALFHEAQKSIKTSLDAQCCTAVMRACAEGMGGLRSGSVFSGIIGKIVVVVNWRECTMESYLCIYRLGFRKILLFVLQYVYVYFSNIPSVNIYIYIYI